MTAQFRGLIGKVATGAALSRDEAANAFEQMMSGEATPSQMGALLMGLRVRGETVDEITGAVTAMRAKMLRVKAPPDAIDVVGTGGDASGSFNISTCAALIVAGAGVPVAKHGNRALSSQSGAADVLAALGVNIDLSPDKIALCIREAGIGFMFAPAHHPATKNVAATRVELGTRTIFNLLGPLSNPAGVRRQMIGVFSRQWTEPLAQVLKNLGAEAVWVVHGSDGLDEITTSGPTSVTALENGAIRSFEISPEEVGLPKVKPEALRGGDAATNARAVQEVLEGKKSAVARRGAVQCRGRACRRRQGQGAQGRPRARRAIGRFRRSRRPARSADRGVERWLIFWQKIARLQARGDRRGKTCPPARRGRARGQGREPAARLFARDRTAAQGRRLCADRRDQEGEPVEGSHSRRFRSAGAGQGLRSRRRRLPFGVDRRAVVPGPSRSPARGARRRGAAGAAQGFHVRPLSGGRSARAAAPIAS